MSYEIIRPISHASPSTLKANPPRVLVLYPYLLESTWVFDDERTNLKEEAFVLGTSEMITRVLKSKRIPKANSGFALSFSDQAFDGYDVERHWVRSDGYSGNWYAGEVVGLEMENWLCPALLLYFQTPPHKLFVRCEKLPTGINPIWNPSDDARPTTLVSAPKNERRDS